MIMCECAYCDCPHGYPVEAGDGGDVCQPCVDGNHEGKRVYPLRYSPAIGSFVAKARRCIGHWHAYDAPCAGKVE